MSSLFGSKYAAPAPGDRVRPLHFFEDSLLVQGNNMAVSLVFNEVLDPDKLRQTLESLVKRPGWERLGGRLKTNASGKIEWHIPVNFTVERPAITFVHVDHGVPAASHPAASRIPKPSTKPAVVGDPDDLVDIAWEPGYKPNGIKDYLNTDRPVLGLRVNSFDDKTIVTLQWQHVTFDALGMQYVVEAWCAILWGKVSDILTPLSADSDPFDVLAQGTRPASEQHVLADRRVGLGGMLRWGLGYGVDMFVRAKENRMVCVPESYWRPQLENALEELRAEAVANGEDLAKVFLTENDVLTAWILQSTERQMAPNPERLVAASIAMSLRKAFEGDLIPFAARQPYVGNAFGWANVLVRAGDVVSKPLSWLACQIRSAINQQGTRAQHEAYYSMVRSSGIGLPIVVFGDGGMAQVGFSNWSKAGLFDLDFAPARKESENNDQPCRPSYVQENHGPVKPVDGFFILGKDSQGNYWTSAYKVKGSWNKFQEQLDKAFKT
ncbi:Transcriptional regulator [Lachnellula subtilissima]|uniref:Transcriptional regulator n=1 Tax=Lachnellula subtilissima TaxID=602034 RepID=A0A8H8RBA7_9HELO|nr:Transcriptional regulator [Lachnellula subtilissima]